MKNRSLRRWKTYNKAKKRSQELPELLKKDYAPKFKKANLSIVFGGPSPYEYARPSEIRRMDAAEYCD